MFRKCSWCTVVEINLNIYPSTPRLVVVVWVYFICVCVIIKRGLVWSIYISLFSRKACCSPWLNCVYHCLCKFSFFFPAWTTLDEWRASCCPVSKENPSDVDIVARDVSLQISKQFCISFQ